jgi:hypothetical protein
MQPIPGDALCVLLTPSPIRPARHPRALIVAMLCVMTSLSLLTSSARGAEVHGARCDTPAHRFALGHRVSHLQTVLKTRYVWILDTPEWAEIGLRWLTVFFDASPASRAYVNRATGRVDSAMRSSPRPDITSG